MKINALFYIILWIDGFQEATSTNMYICAPVKDKTRTVRRRNTNVHILIILLVFKDTLYYTHVLDMKE